MKYFLYLIDNNDYDIINIKIKNNYIKEYI